MDWGGAHDIFRIIEGILSAFIMMFFAYWSIMKISGNWED